MSTSYWSRVERGRVDVGIRTVTRIAIALEIVPTALLDEIETPPDVETPDSGALAGINEDAP